MSKYAKIISLEEFKTIRDSLGTIVATSGGYDPSHPGHLSCLIDSKQYGNTLVAIVNGDWFLKNKKGKPFMDLATRCKIVSCIREVDFVIPFEIENDTTVCKALEAIRPHIFTKGGDRTDFTNIPEWNICEKYGIKIIPQVGLNKEWSSSDFLKEWEDHTINKLASENEDYIVIGDTSYERLEGNTVNIELDLDDETINNIKSIMISGNFVSKGEAIRAALKEAIRSLPEIKTETEVSVPEADS